MRQKGKSEKNSWGQKVLICFSEKNSWGQKVLICFSEKNSWGQKVLICFSERLFSLLFFGFAY